MCQLIRIFEIGGGKVDYGFALKRFSDVAQINSSPGYHMHLCIYAQTNCAG